MQIWDYGSGQLIEDIPFSPKEQAEFLYVGRFCSGDMIAAGGSGTNDLRLIKRQTHEVSAPSRAPSSPPLPPPGGGGGGLPYIAGYRNMSNSKGQVFFSVLDAM